LKPCSGSSTAPALPVSPSSHRRTVREAGRPPLSRRRGLANRASFGWIIGRLWLDYRQTRCGAIASTDATTATMTTVYGSKSANTLKPLPPGRLFSWPFIKAKGFRRERRTLCASWPPRRSGVAGVAQVPRPRQWLTTWWASCRPQKVKLRRV
jgi:hypothetical protein